MRRACCAGSYLRPGGGWPPARVGAQNAPIRFGAVVADTYAEGLFAV